MASMAIIMNTIGFDLTANAKVIEPEIVKTETWTTSYFIDDDMETLYPYIDCQADIYNDGTMKVYFWNTHEWDGFATVKHRVTIISCTNSFSPYVYQTGAEIRKSISGDGVSNLDISKFDKSYFSTDYECDTSISPSYFGGSGNYFGRTTSAYSYIINNCSYEFTYLSFYGALPNLEVNSKQCFSFTPVVDPTGTYEFHIFGHDITITPDILSSSIVSQPQLTEQEKYIKELEEKIQKLEKASGSIQANGTFGDIDGNDMIDGRDASMLLTYYAKTSTGYTGTLEEYVESVKETESSGSLMDFFSE